MSIIEIESNWLETGILCPRCNVMTYSDGWHRSQCPVCLKTIPDKNCDHNTSIFVSEENGIEKNLCTWACQQYFYTRLVDGLTVEVQSRCGHPLTAVIQTDEGTCFCSDCEKEL